MKNAHSRISSSCADSPASRAARSPLPSPNQPGTTIRVCVQPNTHGIARRSSNVGASRPGRRDGREPTFSSPSSSTGVAEEKNRGSPGCPTSARYAVRAASLTTFIAASQRSSVAPSMRDDWCSSVASSTAARRISRLSWARAGSEYLSETTSPCSVSFIVASTVPNGADSTASAAGPPPRPTEPPRPWNSRSRTPCLAPMSRSCRWARWISHCDVVIPAPLLESE